MDSLQSGSIAGRCTYIFQNKEEVMWDQDQLDKAKYTVYHGQEGNRPHNRGTIEIEGANGGQFLMTPVPPFGSLTGENSIAGVKFATHVPQKSFTIQYAPKGLPVPERPTLDRYVIHEYGDGSL
jgi:hypothetical protein